MSPHKGLAHNSKAAANSRQTRARNATNYSVTNTVDTDSLLK